MVTVELPNRTVPGTGTTLEKLVEEWGIQPEDAIWLNQTVSVLKLKAMLLNL